MTPTEFFNEYGSEAIRSTRGINLFPSVMLAQAAIESSWGKSTLTRLYNNFFGIKADAGWKGKFVMMGTTEVFSGNKVEIVAGFRVYRNAVQSFKDRNDFLIENPRYQRHGVFAATTPESQAHALKAAGYATDPDYAEKIINMINRYNLKKYDRLKTTYRNMRIAGTVLLGSSAIVGSVYAIKKAA